MPTKPLKRRFGISVMLLYLLFPIVASAQTGPCTLSFSSLPAAPELKGFYLGMTMEQAKALVPEIVFGRTDELGSTKTTINPAFDPRTDKARFQDVRSISLEFHDGQLNSLWIGYDASFKWNSVSDFVTGISKSLALPDAWTDSRSRSKALTCKDFQLTISMIAQSPSFRIVDTAATDILTARRNAAAEESEAAETEDSEPEEIVADRNTKTYYPGSCRRPRPITEANRVTFKTIAEAEQAGYTPSRICS
jgi:hypothetical protein